MHKVEIVNSFYFEEGKIHTSSIKIVNEIHPTSRKTIYRSYEICKINISSILLCYHASLHTGLLLLTIVV